MKKIMLVLLAGLLVMGLAACQEKEPPVSGGDLTDEPGKVRIFNEGGDQVHSSGHDMCGSMGSCIPIPGRSSLWHAVG